MLDYARVTEVVREEMLADYVPNACIAAARVTTLALRRLGVHTEAMACELEVFSPGYARMSEHFAGLGRQPTEAEVYEWRDRGAWQVSLVFDPTRRGAIDNRTGGYFGHVVVLAENRTVLLDPTLPQVERPEKGIVVPPPYVFPLAADQREAGFRDEGGVTLLYRLLPGRRDFIRAPDWRVPGAHRQRIQQRLITRVTERLQEVVYAANH